MIVHFVFECCAHTGGHGEVRTQERQACHDVVRWRGDRQSGRSGVWCRKRVGAEMSHRRHPQPSSQVADLADELAPCHIGLGSMDDHDIVTGKITADRDRDLGPIEMGVDPTDEAHHRSPGAKVDVCVVIEDRHHIGLAVGNERLGGGACSPACIDPAGEVDDQDRVGERSRGAQPTQRRHCTHRIRRAGLAWGVGLTRFRVATMSMQAGHERTSSGTGGVIGRVEA